MSRKCIRRVDRVANEAVAGGDVFISEFMEDARSKKFSPDTVVSYKRVLEGFLRFLESQGIADVKDVTLDDIGKFSVSLRDRNLSAWSVCGYIGVVKTFFRFLEGRGHIFMNPAAGFRIRTPDRRIRNVPSVEDIERLLAQPDISTVIGIRNRTFLETAYSTGARLSELTGMDVKSINLEKNTARVLGKGKIERMLPLTKQASCWLEKYISSVRCELLRSNLNEPALWVDFYGRRMSKWTVGVFCRNYSLSAGLSKIVRIHAVRRACATHMLRNGAHPVQIQNLLGHSSSKTICHYIDAAMPDIRATHAASAPGK